MHPLRAAILAKIEEQIACTEGLFRLLPEDCLDARPIAGAWPVGVLLGHILDCLSGFCAVLAAAYPERLKHFGRLRDLPVNQSTDPATALSRLAEYCAHIDEGFSLLTDADLARPLPTVFVPAGEPILTLLLGNLEHLINHKHELFICLKLIGVTVGTADLYCLRGNGPPDD